MDPPAERVLRRITEAQNLYHRLVLLVAPSGGGKTAALRAVHDRTKAPLININLELARRMLELTARQRYDLPKLLREIVNAQGDVVLLDNIEILFDGALKGDPLRLLLGLSRNSTVVVAWAGTVEDEHLIYATPGHPEYKKYPVQDFLVA